MKNFEIHNIMVRHASKEPLAGKSRNLCFKILDPFDKVMIRIKASEFTEK